MAARGFKRPSHAANLSWQTRAGKLQKVGKLVLSRVISQHTGICNMADLFSAVALT